MTPFDSLMHDRVRTQLAAIATGQSGTYLFHGPQGVGKATIAAELVRRLNCQGDQAQLCANCQLVVSGAYPDYINIGPQDKPSITITQIRSLIQTLSLSPYYATGSRVVLIDNAHLLTTEAQNALLKIIEEPPAHTLFILVTHQPAALLTTVRSRATHIFFPTLPGPTITKLLSRQSGLTPVQTSQLAAIAAGAPGRAITLASQSAQAAAQLELLQSAQAVVGLSLFERLQLAARLVTNKADLAQWSQYLQNHLTTSLRAAPGPVGPTPSRQLAALEQFRRQLTASVTPRVALESLMVSL